MTGQTLGWRRGYGLLLGATLASVVLADWLFYGHVVGWTAGLFLTVLVGLLLLRGARFFRWGPGRVLFAAVAGLAVALIEEPSALAVIMAAVLVAMLSVLNRADWRAGVVVWARRLLDLSTRGMLRLITDNRIAARWLARHPMSKGRPGRRAVLWVVPAVLGAGFVGLFALANPIISKALGELADVVGNLWSICAELRSLPRNAFWVGTAMAVYALLRVSRRGDRGADAGRGGAPSLEGAMQEFDAFDPAGALKTAVLTTGVVVRCLLVFNALFFIQNGLDVVYLFGGAALPDGMGYAAYAHRGAYPLVATALLAAAFVLAAFRPGAAAERSTLARRLVYLWVAQNVFLTFTAAWRLDLYVDAYSLTRMRFAAGVWMVLVAAGLAWIGCRIVLGRSNAWLLHGNILTAAAVLYACCFFDINGIIADFNVRHCREAGGGGAAIDLTYLRSLGPEALPALRRITPKIGDSQRTHVADQYARELRAELAEELSDWRGWTLRRGRIVASAGEPAPSVEPATAKVVRAPSRSAAAFASRRR